MNFDRRSLRINTEIGLIIDSPQLAGEIAKRFEAIAQPANSYHLVLDHPGSIGPAPIRWVSVDEGKTARYDTEPEVDAVKRSFVDVLSLLPLDELM
jgi:cardiolipin synthase C